MIRTLCLLGLTGALGTVAFGQTVGDRRPAERSVGEPQTTVSLSNDADIRRHYNELQRTLRQLNADELEQLYDEYRAARAAISDENAQLAARLTRETNEAHGALREQNLDNTARSQRTREIQEGFAVATAERQAQYLEGIDKLESRYASDRAERRTLLDREISLLQVQTSEALARFQAGAGSATSLPSDGTRRNRQARCSVLLVYPVKQSVTY
jgi:hypothetical protein